MMQIYVCEWFVGGKKEEKLQKEKIENKKGKKEGGKWRKGKTRKRKKEEDCFHRHHFFVFIGSKTWKWKQFWKTMRKNAPRAHSDRPSIATTTHACIA